jgi:hypothetical protein
MISDDSRHLYPRGKLLRFAKACLMSGRNEGNMCDKIKILPLTAATSWISSALIG